MRTRGFTLIELLVVIAIIGILSSVVLASLNTARAKARDATRLSDLHQLQVALEVYYNDNGVYPASSGWRSACPNYGGYSATSGANAWVPNIAPTYIPSVPFDPKPGPNGYQCYLYNSNGTDYMVLAYLTVETYTTANNPMKRPSQPGENDFAVYSPGAAAW